MDLNNKDKKPQLSNDLQLSPKLLILLHLIPGFFVAIVYTVLARFFVYQNFPPILALLLTWVIAGIPLEAGILLYYRQRLRKKSSLSKIILYREPLKLRQYLWLIPVLLVWTAIGSTLLNPLGKLIQQTLFSWWPDWLLLSAFVRNLKLYPRPVLWLIVFLSFGLNIMVPLMEELYFRGFLLPRLYPMNKKAPLINLLLFAVYHFWQPWEYPGLIITLLPVVYVVAWKRNIYLSIIAHCLLNTIGSIGLMVMIINL